MDVQKTGSSPPHYLRWACVAIYSLFLFFSAVYIYPLARWAQARGYGWIGTLFSQIAIAVISGFLLIQAVRSIRRGRLVNVLIMIVIGASFILALHLIHVPLEQFHFVQYGVLGMLIFWALSGRPFTFQFYLSALTIILGIGYLDEIIQGLVPHRFYDLEDAFVDLLSGTMGLLLFRITDVAGPPALHPSSPSKHGVSTEPLPMIDLHVFWRDLLHLIPILTIVLIDQYLVKAILPEDIIGHWSCADSPRCSLTLGNDGNALLAADQSVCAFSYAMEGNLLDGFRIRIGQAAGGEEPPHECKGALAHVFEIHRGARTLHLRSDELGVLQRTDPDKQESPGSASHG